MFPPMQEYLATAALPRSVPEHPDAASTQDGLWSVETAIRLGAKSSGSTSSMRGSTPFRASKE